MKTLHFPAALKIESEPEFACPYVDKAIEALDEIQSAVEEFSTEADDIEDLRRLVERKVKEATMQANYARSTAAELRSWGSSYQKAYEESMEAYETLERGYDDVVASYEDRILELEEQIKAANEDAARASEALG